MIRQIFRWSEYERCILAKICTPKWLVIYAKGKCANIHLQIYSNMRNDWKWLEIWVEDIFLGAILQLHIENLGGRIKDHLKTESEPSQGWKIKWSYDYRLQCIGYREKIFNSIKLSLVHKNGINFFWDLCMDLRGILQYSNSLYILQLHNYCDIRTL